MNDVYRVAPTAARRWRSAATATPTSSSRRRRPTARRWRCQRPRHRLRAVVAPRPQPSRRSGDLAARPDRRRRAGAHGARSPTAARRSCGRCGRPTASRCSSCPTAAAPRTSGRRRVAAGRAAAAHRASPTAACSGRRSPAAATSIVFERNFGIWKLDTSPAARASEVPITRMGAPAGPAVEHLRLTNAVPGSRALARRQEGRVRGARRDLRRVGEGRRRRGARDHDAGRGVAGRLVARQPPHGLFVGARRRSARLVALRLRDQRQRRRSRAATDGDYAPRFSPDGKSIAFVRGGTELRVIDLDAKKERVARQRASSPTRSGVGRPLAWSPDGRWLAFFTAGTRGFTNVVGRRRRRRRGAAGQLPRQRQRHGDRLVARRHVPVFDTGQRTEAAAARARRPDPAHAEVPRGSVPRSVQRGDSGPRSTAPPQPTAPPKTAPAPHRTTPATARPSSGRGQARQAARKARGDRLRRHPPAAVARARPASTSARRSSARTARPPC